MTAPEAPYTLLRRDGESPAARVDPPRGALDPPAAAPEGRGSLTQPEVARLIAERNFAVAFQPVVRLADRQPVGHEALLRLHPPPGASGRSTRAFVDAAQHWDLGPALDLAVLDVAFAAWPRDAATPLSVNVSARSLRDPLFLASLRDRIADVGAMLAVEITGLDDEADLPAVITAIAALRGAGVRVVLDDFATGNLHLACVRAAAFDAVKFSDAVVGEAMAGPRGQKLLRALVALADAAGARTVAKMIETAPQARRMQDLGVACGQGWLFGAPALYSADHRRAARAA